MKNEHGRRDFLKKLGMASVVVSGVSMAGCSSKDKSSQKWSVEGTGGEPTGEMTYRTNPNTGDKVSLLGYGCMRWPMKRTRTVRISSIRKRSTNWWIMPSNMESTARTI